MEEFREAARKRVKELEEKIEKKEVPNFSRDEIRGTGSTAAEYQKVKDQVLKFIQPCHNWFPTITKIEKVTNLELEKKFEAAKSTAFGDYIDTKFHGTSTDALKGIIRKGFRMPDAKSSHLQKTWYVRSRNLLRHGFVQERDRRFTPKVLRSFCSVKLFLESPSQSSRLTAL